MFLGDGKTISLTPTGSTYEGGTIQNGNGDVQHTHKMETEMANTDGLYIRRNYSLYQQLTKTSMRILELPSSPLDKKTLQDRWTVFPSPLPVLLPNGGIVARQDIRMKSLPSFGFHMRKLDSNSISIRKNKPGNVLSGGGSISPRRGVLVVPRRRRNNRTPVVHKSTTDCKTKINANEGKGSKQSSITGWVVPQNKDGALQSEDLNTAKAKGYTTGVPGVPKAQQRSIMVTAYSVMQEENNRNRQAIHATLNILNCELVKKNECYQMIMTRTDLLSKENAAEMIMIFKGIGGRDYDDVHSAIPGTG